MNRSGAWLDCGCDRRIVDIVATSRAIQRRWEKGLWNFAGRTPEWNPVLAVPMRVTWNIRGVAAMTRHDTQTRDSLHVLPLSPPT
jgi:hypothetical protein